MRKQELLNLVKQIQARSELEEINDLRSIQVLDVLLDYINDKEIREAVEEILL